MKISYIESSQIATEKYFGEKHSYKPYASSKEVFESVLSGESKHGVVLIDDSWRGSNYEVYDHFTEYEDIHVVSEINYEVKKNKSYSRYFIISKKALTFKDNNKSSMIFVVSHKAGSLYRALAIFENYELNLTKIESRRVYGKPYEYMFYVDFEYNDSQKNKIEEIVAVYKENTQYLRIIGYYRSN